MTENRYVIQEICVSAAAIITSNKSKKDQFDLYIPGKISKSEQMFVFKTLNSVTGLRHGNHACEVSHQVTE